MVLKRGHFGKLDLEYLESFEMRCWTNIEKISWVDHMRNEEVLERVNKERNIPQTLNGRKPNWTGLIFRRNCLRNTLLRES